MADQQTPDFAALLEQAKQQADPRFYKAGTPIEDMGWLQRNLGPFLSSMTRGMLGGPEPIGSATDHSILLNRQMMEKTPDLQGMIDTLNHEGRHVQQFQQRTPAERTDQQHLQRGYTALGFGGMGYGQQTDEMDAYQAENDARAATGLSMNPTPGFRSGQMHANTDVYLPRDAKRKAILQQLGR